jgi:hypothetical protein
VQKYRSSHMGIALATAKSLCSSFQMTLPTSRGRSYCSMAAYTRAPASALAARVTQQVSLTFSVYHHRDKNTPTNNHVRDAKVQTIEITSSSEARRCRQAQYRGDRPATVTLNGERVTGVIHAVKEDSRSTPLRWMVSMVKLSS